MIKKIIFDSMIDEKKRELGLYADKKSTFIFYASWRCLYIYLYVYSIRKSQKHDSHVADRSKRNSSCSEGFEFSVQYISVYFSCAWQLEFKRKESGNRIAIILLCLRTFPFHSPFFGFIHAFTLITSATLNSVILMWVVFNQMVGRNNVNWILFQYIKESYNVWP